MPGETPAQDPLSQVVPGKVDMGDDYDAIVVQMAQLMEHSDPAQKPPWDGSGLPETVAEMQALDAEDLGGGTAAAWLIHLHAASRFAPSQSSSCLGGGVHSG